MQRSKLKKSDNRQAHDLIYGPHAIIEMLKAGRRKLISLYTTRPLPKGYERLARYLPRRVPNIQYVTRSVLERMAGTSEHGGVVALVSPFPYAKQMFDPKKKPFLLLLDSIQDVRNLGAILRSASCVGVDGIVISKKGGAPLTPAAIKTSAGLAEHLDIYVAPSAKAAVAELKKAGYALYMAVVDGKNATEVSYQRPLCLVIGNEAIGIEKSIQKEGTRITLPQRSPDISYNASVAAGILLFVLAHGKQA